MEQNLYLRAQGMYDSPNFTFKVSEKHIDILFTFSHAFNFHYKYILLSISPWKDYTDSLNNKKKKLKCQIVSIRAIS